MSPSGSKSSTSQLPKLNKVTILHSGKVYFERILHLIDLSKESIHLQYYIFDFDVTGNLVVDHLIAASTRGVKVYLLLDGYASQELPEKLIVQLKEKGIRFKFFEPLLKSKYFYFGRRLHHKIFLVDHRIGIIGGLNISDKYNDINNKKGWLDFAIEFEGETAKDICILCWKSWRRFPSKMSKTPCEKSAYPLPPIENPAQVSMLRNDWVRNKTQITKAYRQLLQSAKSEIIILSSYFLPGRTIRKELENASHRGVMIKIISAGRSDVSIAKFAETWLYDWLLRNKIELYEFQDRVLHGKLGICDDQWFTVGSYNINDISAWASVELNLKINNQVLTNELKKIIDAEVIPYSVRIQEENYKSSKTIWSQFRNWCSYLFIRAVLYLFTFYFKKQKH